MASPEHEEDSSSVEESDTWQGEKPPEYLKQITDLKFLNISIKGYEKKTSGGFTKEDYFAYRIVSILTDADAAVPPSSLSLEGSPKKVRQEVWRRYSEFEALRHFLTTVYPHVVVPPLPEKTIRGSSGLLNKLTFTGEDADFLLKRQQALELFLVRVSRHPILSTNYWFHQFMNNIGWREVVQQTGYTTKAESIFQTISLTLSKLKPDSRFQEVKEYADEAETIFKSLLETREKMNQSMKAVYKVHSNYGRVFSEWSEMEDTLGTSLQVAGGSMDSYAESIDTYFEEEELRYLLPLKEYLAYCDALRMVVHRQEFLQRQLEKAEENLNQKAEAKDALSKENPEQGGGGGGGGWFSLKTMATKLRGGDTSYEARMGQAVRDLQEAEEAMQQAQKQLSTFTTEALKDLKRFSAQKATDFRSMLISFAQLQMHIHRKGITTWERVKQGFETLT